jgi:hypothetical protein
MTSGEAIEDLLKPRLALAKASDVAATRTVSSGDSRNGGVGNSPINGSDRGRWDVCVGWCINRRRRLLVDLACSLGNEVVVGVGGVIALVVALGEPC